MTRSLPPVPQDLFDQFEGERFRELASNLMTSLDFDREAESLLASLQPLSMPVAAPPVPVDEPEDAARRRDQERYTLMQPAAPVPDPSTDFATFAAGLLDTLQPVGQAPVDPAADTPSFTPDVPPSFRDYQRQQQRQAAPPDPFGRVDFGPAVDTRADLPPAPLTTAAAHETLDTAGFSPDLPGLATRVLADGDPNKPSAFTYAGEQLTGAADALAGSLPGGALRGAGNVLGKMGTAADDIRTSAAAGDLGGIVGNTWEGTQAGLGLPGSMAHGAAREVGVPDQYAAPLGLAADVLMPATALDRAAGRVIGPLAGAVGRGVARCAQDAAGDVAGALALVPRYGQEAAEAIGRQVDESGGLVPLLERGELRLPGARTAADGGQQASRPPFALTEEGQAKRAELIAENVKLGIPEEAAAAQVDRYIEVLDQAGQVPAPYIASRDLFRRLATGRGTRDQAVEVAKRAGDLANRTRYSGMLSNPAGALVDIASNALNIPLTYNRIVQASVMEGVGERLGKIRPEERSAVLAELDGLNQGLLAGTVDGMRDALRVMVKGGRPVRAEQPKGLVEGPAGLALEFGQRMRIAADVLFSEVGERMAANALGIREASREGLRYGSGDFRRRAADLSGAIRMRLVAGGVEQGGVLPAAGKTNVEKVEQLAAEALAMSKRGIFQSDLGSTAKAIEDVRGTYVTRFAVPFYRTMANVAAQGVGMTPGAGQLGIAADLVASKAFGKGAYKAGNAFTTTNTAAVLPASHRHRDGLMAGPKIAPLCARAWRCPGDSTTG